MNIKSYKALYNLNNTLFEFLKNLKYDFKILILYILLDRYIELR